MDDMMVEERRGDLLISTDRARIDVDAVLAMLHASHWAGSLTRQSLERAIANSVCVGVYNASGKQLAFARADSRIAGLRIYNGIHVQRGLAIQCACLYSQFRHLVCQRCKASQ